MGSLSAAGAVDTVDQPPYTVVDCYRLDLCTSHAEDLALLDQRERVRAARFRFARDRTRYIAAHAQMRRLLGLRLGVAPAAVPLTLTRHGKPVILRDARANADTAGDDGPCRFNLTHSGAVGYLAVACCSVGIDVELHRPIEDLQPLIDTYCSPLEIASLAAMRPEERCAGFLGIWTRKEAALKAWGTGIGAIALDRLHVGVDSQALPSRLAEPLAGEPPLYPDLRLKSLPGADQVLSVAAATRQPMTVRMIGA